MIRKPDHIFDRTRDLLAAKGYDTRETVLACYSGAGFAPELYDTAHGSGPGQRILLVDPKRMYQPTAEGG